MNTPTDIIIARILAKCRLACGAEAVARGFPPRSRLRYVPWLLY